MRFQATSHNQFEQHARRTLLSRMIKSVRRHPMRALGPVTLILIVLAALCAPLISPYDPAQVVLEQRLKPPFWMPDGTFDHFLGTDQLGRDIWVRIAYGARISLLIGCLAVLVAAPLGVLLGLLAGYLGGFVDVLAMRIADIQLAFPEILLAISLLAVLGRSTRTLVLVIGLTGWVIFARVVRAEVLYLKETDMVLAARALGAGHLRILSRHVLPNALTSVIVLVSFSLAQMILAEASLSFLGLGVQPPTSSWGSMLGDGRDYTASAWWLAMWPGLAVLITVLAINGVGDWLAELLEPRSVL
jgi:peptide/nickel transport system permease protein